MPLSHGKHALVDDEDYHLVSKYKWRLHKRSETLFYAYTNIKGKATGMHRLILDAPKSSIVDHINHNGLDNRRKNIRLCTSTQNCMNRSKTTKKKGSRFKGVWLMKGKKDIWRAGIRIENRTKHLGCYRSERDAAIAYNGAAIALFGEFAHLNKIED